MHEWGAIETDEEARLPDVLARERGEQGTERPGQRLAFPAHLIRRRGLDDDHEVEVGELVHAAREERAARGQPDEAGSTVDPGDELPEESPRGVRQRCRPLSLVEEKFIQGATRGGARGRHSPAFGSTWPRWHVVQLTNFSSGFPSRFFRLLSCSLIALFIAIISRAARFCRFSSLE